MTGPVPARQLGITLIHEHILFAGNEGNWRKLPPPEPWRRPIAEGPLRMETIGWARKYGYEHRDNANRLDPTEACAELNWFKWAGGRTVVDQTPVSLGRDPVALRTIARQTGLNIVMGCGYYVDASHPPELRARSVEAIAQELVTELTEGVGSTGVRAGIIGEIGTGDEVTPNEEKVLRAAARAQAATGAPLSIHHSIWARTAPRLLEIARSEGANLCRTIVSHCDLDARAELEYFQAIASTGAYLGLDTFGHYDFYAYTARLGPFRYRATDWDRAELIARLIAAGLGDRIVVAQDVCFKVQLKRYGGWGFDHILESCVPQWRALGVTEEQVRQILVDNPARVLGGAP